MDAIAKRRPLLPEDTKARLKTLCKQGHLKEALYMLDYLQKEGAKVKPSSYIWLFQSCISIKGLVEGKLVHAHLIECGSHVTISLWTTLVDMYSKFGHIHDARAIFDSMPHHNVVSWTAMIAGYAHHGDDAEEALVLFQEMQSGGLVSPNDFTFLSILNACTNLGSLEGGRMIHVYMIQNGVDINVFIGNALVNMYAKSDDVEDALQVFQTMLDKDVVTWTALITGYTKHGLVEEAFQLVHQMECEGLGLDEVTFVSILGACTISHNLGLGRRVHASLINHGLTPNTALENTLIDMYCKCGGIDEACQLFNKMQVRNIVSWNAMVVGYAKHGIVEEAFKLYHNMVNCPNHVTFVSILKLCATIGDLERGKGIHMDIVWSGLALDVSVGNSLIDLYINCERLEDARRVFDRLSGKDVVSWTAMIAGYSKSEYVDEANKLFWEMEQEGVQPNEVTFLGIITACSVIGHLEQSMQIHSKIVKTGNEMHVFVANALIDMYAKCGDIHGAHLVFDNLLCRDTISWNAIISGYALHGNVRESLLLAEKMRQVDAKPDDITFVGILSACSRAGLVNEGFYIFNSMVRDQHIMPTADHLVCMVDLFARVGHVDDAEELIRQLPLNTSVVVWRALLNACKLHGHAQLATCVVENLLECDWHDASAFVLLLNIFAAAGESENMA